MRNARCAALRAAPLARSLLAAWLLRAGPIASPRQSDKIALLLSRCWIESMGPRSARERGRNRASRLATHRQGRKNTTHSGLGLASAATLTALRRLGALLRKAGRACGTLHLTDPRWARTRCCCIIFLLLLFLAACFNRCCATALLLFFSAARQLARRVFTLVVIRVQVLGAVSICFVVAESGTCVCS